MRQHIVQLSNCQSTSFTGDSNFPVQKAAASAGRSTPAAVNVQYGWLFVTGDVAVFFFELDADIRSPPA